MREIKFRGRYCRGIENAGPWVYWGVIGSDALDCIDGDTIGQYTGLLDKNGVEIYEGDIYTQGDKNIKYVVVFKSAKFAGKQVGNESLAGLSYWQDRIEVIGNIHENPELLEAP